MVNDEVVKFLIENSPFFCSAVHGVHHWRSVERNGLYLAQFTGADRSVVSYFSHFHDCMRQNNGHDPKHGSRATKFLKQNRSKIKLNDKQFDQLCFACSGHTFGRKTDCPTVATCWDADRLDITRVGIDWDISFFFSDEAKRIVEMKDIEALHNFNKIPQYFSQTETQILSSSLQNVVYHSSHVLSLKKIHPRISTHHKSWVYATREPVMSSIFLGSFGGDLACAIGRESSSGLPYLCERFEGAFDKRYQITKGSIYTLPAVDFVTNNTLWQEEIVCIHTVPIIKEMVIQNVKEYLLSLSQRGKLIIKYYPEKIDGIPEDDSDLVKICSARMKKNPDVLNDVKTFHPRLVKRVIDEFRKSHTLHV